MQAVDEYVRSCEPGWLMPGRQDDQLLLRRKTSAQRLARTATRTIEDRKTRSKARIELYNQLIPILERHYESQRKLHRIYRQLLSVVGVALFLTLGIVLV